LRKGGHETERREGERKARERLTAKNVSHSGRCAGGPYEKSGQNETRETTCGIRFASQTRRLRFSKVDSWPGEGYLLRGWARKERRTVLLKGGFSLPKGQESKGENMVGRNKTIKIEGGNGSHGKEGDVMVGMSEEAKLKKEIGKGLGKGEGRYDIN